MRLSARAIGDVHVDLNSTSNLISSKHYNPRFKMSSGYGSRGGPTRCFVFWQEVLACYVANTAGDDSKGVSKCAPALEDYLECINHKKEAIRVEQLQKAYRKQQRENPDPNRKTAEEIRTLGLIDASLEEMNLKVLSLVPHVKRSGS